MMLSLKGADEVNGGMLGVSLCQARNKRNAMGEK